MNLKKRCNKIENKNQMTDLYLPKYKWPKPKLLNINVIEA